MTAQDNAAVALVTENKEQDGFDLHPKVRQFVELYVSDPEIAGNGTKCYAKVYGIDVSNPNSREYGYASNTASDLLLKNPEVERYRKALIGKATGKVRGRIHQAADRAATVLLSVMDGDVRSRLQLDAAVKVLELNGITPVQRSELDVGEKMDALIRDLAAKRPNNPYRRREVGEKAPALIASGRVIRTEDGPSGE